MIRRFFPLLVVSIFSCIFSLQGVYAAGPALSQSGIVTSTGDAVPENDRRESENHREAPFMASDESSRDQAPEKPPVEELPPPAEGIKGAIFERKGGYLHPFLSITEYYTDNLFNTRDDGESDFGTILSPGIWLSVPRLKENLAEIETANIAPGGTTLSRFVTRYPRRFQSYFLYRADIERFARLTSQDTASHTAVGMLQYNMRGGLSVDVADQFVKSHTMRGSGAFFELDKFKTNFFNTILSYEMSDRMLFRVDYANFIVHFTETRNDFRDRADNSVSAYLFYRAWPKTMVFAEYDFLTIDYDENILSDSKEHHVFGGVRWDITAKSRGIVKAGYGVKDFDDPAIDRANDFLFEAQVSHRFTPRTSLKLTMARRTNETDISATNFIVADSVGAEYLQRLSPRITASLTLSYENDRYKGEVIVGEETGNVRETYYRAALAFQYEFKEWLKADLGYVFLRRESNIDVFDFTNNTVFLRVTGSL